MMCHCHRHSRCLHPDRTITHSVQTSNWSAIARARSRLSTTVAKLRNTEDDTIYGVLNDDDGLTSPWSEIKGTLRKRRCGNCDICHAKDMG